MSEFWDSLSAYIKDKAVSPLSGALVVSALAWNYKLIFTLFGGGDFMKKFAYIDVYLYPTWQEKLVAVLVPVAAASFYLLYYHHIALWFYQRVLRQRITVANARTLSERHRLMTEEEAGRLKESHALAVEKLRQALSTARDEMKASQGEAESRMNEFTKLELVLRIVKASGRTLVSNDSDEQEVEIRSILLVGRWLLRYRKSGQNSAMIFHEDGSIQAGMSGLGRTWKVEGSRVKVFDHVGRMTLILTPDPEANAFRVIEAPDIDGVLGGTLGPY
ncbi:hypothetical protein [Pseudoxanthomonas sp.]|uniref:hypothetical protein n=1 Tax=Pseudoxanthomonas sp. TaxID=1871049 RepID=UPI003F7D0099